MPVLEPLVASISSGGGDAATHALDAGLLCQNRGLGASWDTRVTGAV